MNQKIALTLPQFQFSGKQVWVTGAGQGIGRRVAEYFSILGAQVIGIDCNFPDASTVENNCVTRVQLDISKPQQVAEVLQNLIATGPVLDVLVNAAGVLRLGALDTISSADWQTCFDVNVSGVFYILQTLLPHFKQQRSGAIVNISSNAAHVPRMGMGAYCASKAALTSLSHCAALELAEYGVRCNLVSPGSTDTPMLRSMLGDEAAYQRTINGLPENFKLGIPLKKIATTEDIANTVLFLASDLASHITMQDIVVDGGATLAA